MFEIDADEALDIDEELDFVITELLMNMRLKKDRASQ
jgi:CMP-N-acetylneuraminic acid synthetase